MSYHIKWKKRYDTIYNIMYCKKIFKNINNIYSKYKIKNDAIKNK